jgi:3-hydroxyisobutyrate dehydrogenase-like beta-hydroxyacid dehydrogenase
MQVGFLGLGTMGKAMAANLIKAGHALTVWNRSPAPAEELRALGARRAGSPTEAFGGEAVIVITMFADDASTNAVLTEALLQGAPEGLIHVNMATISVAACTSLNERLMRHGLVYVAAPVFGRAEVAAAGKLNIVASGPDDAIARAQPLFDAMGQKTWRAGTDPAQATLVKITGNFMLAASIEMLSEAFSLAEKGGVDPKVFAEIMTGTLFAAPAFKIYSELINAKRFEPAGFKMTLGLKDVGLALEAGQALRTPLPLASLVRDHFLEALAAGHKDKDWSALSAVVRRNAGLAE